MSHREEAAPRRDRTIRVLFGTLALVALVATLLAAPASPAGAATDDEALLTFVREWPQRAAQNEVTAMIPDPVNRRVISVGLDSLPTPAPTGLKVTVFSETVFTQDADRDAVRRCEDPVVLGCRNLNPRVGGSGDNNNPQPWAFDPDAQLLYLLAYHQVQTQIPPALPRLVVLDVSDPANDIPTVADKPLGFVPAGVRVVGMSLHDDGDDQLLYFVGHVPSVSVANARTNGPLVAEVDVDHVLDSSQEVIAPTGPPIEIPRCQTVIANRHQAAVVRVDDTVFVGCGTTNLGDTVIPGTASVAAVNLENPLLQESYFLPGRYGRGETFFDPDAGDKGRLLIVGSAVFGTGPAVWVFDTAERTMVGQIAAKLMDAAGVDPVRGRVYVAVGDGILVATSRGRPLGQALPPIGGIDTQARRIMTIPFNQTMVMRVRVDVGNGPETVWGIYRDDIPASRLAPAEPTDFDRTDEFTSDMPQFSGDAQAFGYRMHEIGGVNAVVSNAAGSNRDVWNEPVIPGTPIPSPHDATGLRDGNRDLHAAWVFRSQISADEAAGKAINLIDASDDDPAADSLTADDWKTLSGKLGMNGGEGENWPAGWAQCADFGGNTSTNEGESSSIAGTGEPATAHCDQRGGRTHVTAHYGGLGHEDLGPVHDLVQVGEASAEATLEFDRDHPEKGLEVVATAEARDVTIAGVVQIGRVSSVARARAFGGHTPLDGDPIEGSNTASYERLFEGVSTPTFSCGSNCDPSAVVAALSDALGTQFRIELPRAELWESDGGSHAHAWRDPWEHEQEIFLNQQNPTEIQVPALRITAVTDGAFPSRRIIDLAATKADATSIHVKEPEPFVFPDFDDFDVDLAPITTQVDATPITAPPSVDLPRTDGPSEPETRTVRIAQSTASSDDELAAPPPRASSFLEEIREKARWLFGRALTVFLLGLGVWLLLGAPAFLAARRRHLRRLVNETASL